MEQPHLLFRVFSDQEMKSLFDPDNPQCPFYGYVGNRPAVEAVLDIAYKSYQPKGFSNGKPVTNRECRNRFRLDGPASSGKTTLVKRFAKLLELPYVETEGSQIKNSEDLFDLIVDACEEKGLTLEPIGQRGDTDLYELPPMLCFIDEAHLSPGKVQDRLLKATEANDGLLLMKGKSVDCREVCFILGTTDVGKLRPAFRTRFQSIDLKKHTFDELVKIIQLNYPKFPVKVCRRIAELLPVPREAIRFGQTVIDASARRNIDLMCTVEMVRKREGLEVGGINRVGVSALRVLEQGELSKNNLCSTLGIAMEEWENIVLPTLLTTDRHPAYVEVSHRHRITPAGIRFLSKCG